MKKVLLVLLAGFFSIPLCIAQEKTYVGEEVCGTCHLEEYENFTRYAKKAHSFDKIQVLRGELTESEYQGCLNCHTTGYGQSGGFVDEKTTPDLRNPGCEVCHGPGSVHVETMDKADITTLDIEGCEKCHNNERIKAFNYRPLKYGGAH